MRKAISEIELQLKMGNGEIAKQLLQELPFKELNRLEVYQCAQLARRLQLPKLILKLLRPYVNPEVKGELRATSEEQALYASGLTRLGLYREAEKILNDLSEDSCKEVLLYKAHLNIFSWDYEKALVNLKKYRTKIDDPYALLVTDLNISAAYLHTFDFIKFGTTASRLLDSLKSSEYKLLYGNILELFGQAFIIQKQFSRAKELLLEAKKHLANSPEKYSRFIEKWLAIAHIMEDPAAVTAEAEIKRLKMAATENGDWETFRELCFYAALAKNDQDEVTKIFWGTPFPGYRAKMKRLWGRELPKINVVRWRLPLTERGQSQASASAKVFGLTSYFSDSESSDQNGILPGSQPLLCRLVQALCEDFYRPLTIGELFSKIYPDQYYSVDSSPERVKQAIKRLNRWFKESQIPVLASVSDSQVFLNAEVPTVIDFSIQHQDIDAHEQLLKKVKLEMKSAPFSSENLVDLLNISPRRAFRILEWGKKNNLIYGGKGTGLKKYRFVA